MSKKLSLPKEIMKILSGRNAMSTNQLHDEITGLEENLETVQKKYAVKRAIKSMQEAGIIEIHNTDWSEYARLTPEGRKRAGIANVESTNSPIPYSWDGYWRVILLDLPESRKAERDSLRYLLRKAGFAPLKNSVWISPFPYEYLFENLKKDLSLEQELIILRTEVNADTEKHFRQTWNMLLSQDKKNEN